MSKAWLDEVYKARLLLKQHGVSAQTERAERDVHGTRENQIGSHGGLSEEPVIIRLVVMVGCLRSP